MGNIIDFLVRAGQDASLRHADGADLASALDEADVPPAARLAIEAGDGAGLRELLDRRVFFSTQLDPMKKEDEEEGQEEDEEEADGTLKDASSRADVRAA